MERSSKRGKIPQSDWPLIMARYEAGETLSSIARTYDCSPPAISYVVSRSRARQPSGETPPPTPTGESPLRPAPQAAANAAQRGRLHLSLGNGSHGNGGSQPEPRFTERPHPPAPQPTPQYASPNGGSERPVSSAPSPHRYPGSAEPNHH